MTTITKYAIERIETGERVRSFSTLPETLDTPDGQRVISPVAIGDEGLGYRLIQIDEVDFEKPGTFFHQGADVETREGAVVTITREWTPWTQAEIDAYEAGRRDDVAADMDNVESVIRAAVLVIMDESNSHATALAAIKAAFANNSTVAAIRTAVAAIQMPPQRTAAQLKTAIRAKLGVV
jgi:hypothetical protein